MAETDRPTWGTRAARQGMFPVKTSRKMRISSMPRSPWGMLPEEQGMSPSPFVPNFRERGMRRIFGGMGSSEAVSRHSLSPKA